MAIKIVHGSYTSKTRLERTTALPNYTAITTLLQFKIPVLPPTHGAGIISWCKGSIVAPTDVVFVGVENGDSDIEIWTASGSSGGPRIASSVITADVWYNLVVRGATGAGGPLDMFLGQIGSPMTKYTGTYNGDGNFNGSIDVIYLGNSNYNEGGNISIQNVKWYNAVLSDAECANEVQQFLPERMNNMVGWWPMVDSTTANCYKDLTGTGNFTEVIEGAGSGISVDGGAPVPWGGMVITMPGTATAAATQYARPISTISSGAWSPSTGATLYETIDEESPNDADYNLAVSATTFEVKLSSVSDPLSNVGHYVRYRINGTGGANLVVSLRQDAGTEIASWTHSPAPVSPTTYERTLTTMQADAITNYADLRMRFVSS